MKRRTRCRLRFSCTKKNTLIKYLLDVTVKTRTLKWKCTRHMMRSTTGKWTKKLKKWKAEKMRRRFAQGLEKDSNGQANVEGS